MWAFRGTTTKLNLFDFTVSRHRDGPELFFADYSGVLLAGCGKTRIVRGFYRAKLSISRTVRVKTLSASELPAKLLKSKIDLPGKPDFYAKVTIDGQWFTESMQLNSDSISPSWSSTAFIPVSRSSVEIRYELWDEDGGAAGDGDLCDILAASGEKLLSLTLRLHDESLTGGLSGVHNTEATAAETSGGPPDKDRASVKLVISKKALVP